ncbi:hypothetical protein EhV145_00450 [Emiliania huxleyi virus 145]|nr:hypothetical protein EhV145_00450 [Emiliania huxleyi virus 145]
MSIDWTCLAVIVKSKRDAFKYTLAKGNPCPYMGFDASDIYFDSSYADFHIPYNESYFPYEIPVYASYNQDTQGLL